MEAKISWNSHYSFTGNSRNHEISIDTTLSNGSLNRGANPKELMLNALGACAGMDIIAVLKEKNNLPLTLNVDVAAVMTKTRPSYFSNILVKFKLVGNTTEELAKQSCLTSMTKLCGVSLMLTKVCPVLYEVYLNDQLIFSDSSRFEL
jgi:putative redox protein